MMMKAVRVHAFGAPEQLVYEDVPDPVPGPGEVIVSVAASGVNPADYKFRNGSLAAAVPRLPFVPGMDIAGRIEAVGASVSGWQVGERVLAMLHLMGNGGYAEKVAVPAEWCTPMPPRLGDRLAAALPTPVLTAVEWIEDDLAVASGERVLVTGAVGAVGVVACFAAKARGGHVTAGVRRSQADIVRYADDILLLDDGGGAGGSFDCIADTVGGETAQRLLARLKPGGVLSTVATDPVANPEERDVVIRFFGNYPAAARLTPFAAAVAEGNLVVAEPRVMRMSEAPTAHALMEQGGAGKIVLVPDALL